MVLPVDDGELRLVAISLLIAFAAPQRHDAVLVPVQNAYPSLVGRRRSEDVQRLGTHEVLAPQLVDEPAADERRRILGIEARVEEPAGLEIIIGIIFLGNNLFLAISLPVIFAMWVLFESVIIAVDSFDYKRVGFPGWFVILLLGICGIVLGILGLKNPDITARTLSTLIGLGVIAMGAAYLFALLGITRFEKKVEGFRRGIGIDEQ